MIDENGIEQGLSPAELEWIEACENDPTFAARVAAAICDNPPQEAPVQVAPLPALPAAPEPLQAAPAAPEAPAQEPLPERPVAPLPAREEDDDERVQPPPFTPDAGRIRLARAFARRALLRGLNGHDVPKAPALATDYTRGRHVVSVGSQLHLYERDRGLYQIGAEEHACRWLLNELGDDYTPRRKKEFLDTLCIGCAVDAAQAERDSLRYVNVRNGLIDLETTVDGHYQLIPHTPEILTFQQLPTVYDPDVIFQRGYTFLDEVMPADNGESRAVLEEFMGYCLLRDCRFQKALMLSGNGSNGKSVTLGWIEAMLGKDNCSSLQLRDISHEYKAALLQHKLANICSDLSARSLNDSANFKMAVTGDRMAVNKKYAQPFEFNNSAKLLFACNELPEGKDLSDGFFRRWIIVTFPNRFRKIGSIPPPVHTADPQLPRLLYSEEGKSWLLNQALKGLRRLLENNGFTEGEAARASIDEYRQLLDPVAAFFHECAEYQEGARVTKDAMYASYLQFMKSENRHDIIAKNAFCRRLRNVESRLQSSRVMVNGVRRGYFYNVKLHADPFSEAFEVAPLPKLYS
jgi:putative DNA primase/helicase